MSISLLAAAMATLAAATLTVLLVPRGRFRVPWANVAAWLCAAAGLTVALALQAAGFYRGFSPATFRALQIGARLIAPAALVWGLAEVTGKRLATRFAAKLALAAMTVVAGVIMATDPLGSAAFTVAWPAAPVYYQVLPNAALDLVAIVTVVSALVAALVTWVRSRREQAWGELLFPVLAVVAASLVIVGLRVALPVKSAYPALCLVAVALIWFAGTRAGRVPLAQVRDELAGRDTGWGNYGPYGDDTGFGGLYRPDTGSFAPYGAGTGYGDAYQADTGYGPGQADDTGGFGRDGADTGYGPYADDTGGFGPEGADTGYGRYADDTGGFGPEGADTGYGRYADDTGGFGPEGAAEDYGGRYGEPDTGFGQHRAYGRNGTGANGADAGIVETGDMLAAAGAPAPDPFGDPADAAVARLYGQIAIYTLLDGRADEFDDLAQEVVEEVRAREPGTLVYVMHSVPSAPMQRILYEVYRDESAFANHARQPYIQQFEEGRKPCVLATNVIELGVRHAKVLPLEAMQPRPAAGRGGARHRGSPR